jgi:hypothetical protein
MASAPRTISEASSFRFGENVFSRDAIELARLALSQERASASVGMATLNALLQPDRSALAGVDAADWLSANGVAKRVAIFGRFPFIQEELKPVAREVWVFERQPQPGEYGAQHMAEILPRADIVAVTSSALINHTIDDILVHILPVATFMILGPGTPLSARLFSCGVDILSGVQITDVDHALQSVKAGVSFRQMKGLERVTLCNKHSTLCEY